VGGSGELNGKWGAGRDLSGVAEGGVEQAAERLVGVASQRLRRAAEEHRQGDQPEQRREEDEALREASAA
jgi:hypothetical protein